MMQDLNLQVNNIHVNITEYYCSINDLQSNQWYSSSQDETMSLIWYLNVLKLATMFFYSKECDFY